MANVTSSKAVTKFSVYQNPTVSAALTTNSIRPSKLTIFFILTLLFISALSLISFILREIDIVNSSKLRYVTEDVAYCFLKVLQAFIALVVIGSLFALLKALSLWRTKPKFQPVEVKVAKEAPKAKANASPSDKLVPLHPPFTYSGHTPHLNRDKSITSGGNRMHYFSTPSEPPVPSSIYFVPSQSPNMETPIGHEQYISSPWRGSSYREISTEKQLETFLADFDEKFSMFAGKMTTPLPTISEFGTLGTNTYGTTRSTPLRAVRMSPGARHYLLTFRCLL